MSHPRRAPLGLALLLSVGAFAGTWVDGNPSVRRPVSASHFAWVDGASVRRPVHNDAESPSSLHPPAVASHAVCSRAAHLHGLVAAITAIDLNGIANLVPIPPGLDLSDPLPLPEGLFAEIEIDLAGPATLDLPLTAAGRNICALDVDTLTVVIDDPDAAAAAGAVVLDLSGVTGVGDLGDGLIGVAE